jgi:hypothetical protein
MWILQTEGVVFGLDPLHQRQHHAARILSVFRYLLVLVMTDIGATFLIC